MEIIRLKSDVIRAILHHSRAVLPAEAVGLLGGPEPGYATYSIPLPNLAGQHVFLADPFAQFKAERQLAQQALHLLAVYHSHPGGGAQLSPMDLMFARRRSCLQIVIALERPNLPGEEIRAYRFLDNTPVEVEVHLG
jgi:proteasome lid subunit RPN8/RPN11